MGRVWRSKNPFFKPQYCLWMLNISLAVINYEQVATFWQHSRKRETLLFIKCVWLIFNRLTHFALISATDWRARAYFALASVRALEMNVKWSLRWEVVKKYYKDQTSLLYITTSMSEGGRVHPRPYTSWWIAQITKILTKGMYQKGETIPSIYSIRSCICILYFPSNFIITFSINCSLTTQLFSKLSTM